MSGPITTPFSADSTAADVVRGHDLRGRRAVVTGGASGIGLETVRALASAGAEVTLAVRDLDGGQRARKEVQRTVSDAELRVAHLDLADRRSISDFVNSWRGPLDVLVNNAGVMATPEIRTAEGWELQFVTNHLGHFALSVGLHDALARAADEHDGSRIVSLSSAGHQFAPLDLTDLTFERRPYDPLSAYGHSKSATIAFVVEADRRWADAGVTVNAVNPGGIATNLQRHFTAEVADYFDRAEQTGVFHYKSVEQGAATTLVAAVAPQFQGHGGRYLDDCQEAPVLPRGSQEQNPHAVRAEALDPEVARQLWSASLDLIHRPLLPDCGSTHDPREADEVQSVLRVR